MLRWRTLLVVSVGYFGPASTAIAQDSAKIEANSHFEKGVAAFRVKRFAEAVSEFELAYKIAPAF